MISTKIVVYILCELVDSIGAVGAGERWRQDATAAPSFISALVGSHTRFSIQLNLDIAQILQHLSSDCKVAVSLTLDFEPASIMITRHDVRRLRLRSKPALATCSCVFDMSSRAHSSSLPSPYPEFERTRANRPLGLPTRLTSSPPPQCHQEHAERHSTRRNYRH